MQAAAFLAFFLFAGLGLCDWPLWLAALFSIFDVLVL